MPNTIPKTEDSRLVRLHEWLAPLCAPFMLRTETLAPASADASFGAISASKVTI